MPTVIIPTYDEFVRKNKESKSFFKTAGHLSEVQALGNLHRATCTFELGGRCTKKIAIAGLVLDVYYNGMGVLSNPSSIKNWDGWGKTVSM